MLNKRMVKQNKSFSLRQKRMYDFFHLHPVGVISTVDPNGDPHGVVVYFDIDENFIVSFLTRTKTKKYDNLMHNNHVMLTVYDEPTQTIAQIIGLAHEVSDDYEINQLANTVVKISIRNSGVNLPPVTKLESGSYVAFKIVPTQARISVYAKHEIDDYKNIFDSVESFELEAP